MKTIVEITRTVEIDDDSGASLLIARNLYDANDESLSEPEFKVLSTDSLVSYTSDGANQLYTVILIDENCKVNTPRTLVGLRYYPNKENWIDDTLKLDVEYLKYYTHIAKVESKFIIDILKARDEIYVEENVKVGRQIFNNYIHSIAREIKELKL